MSQAPESADSLIGLTIGNYKVTSKLGEGGMGAVYLAEHPGIGKKVAVKVLLSEHSKRQDLINRFFNEAKTAASLRHPALVEVFDFGFLPSGAGYLVMDFLEGESLSARLGRVAPLPAEIAAELGRQLCAGVAAAHSKGIVHRDLKPDNVFLVPDPELPNGERVKILDFGIAKLILPGAGGSKGATSTGMLLGTPLYMAPEQCRGTGKVDHRADVYSIGCILYEMLGGRPPFDHEGVGEILAAHLYQPPRPIRDIDPSIPEALAVVVMRALEKDPAVRQQTTAELGGQLQQFLRGGDLQAVLVAPHLSGFGAAPSTSGARPITGPGSVPVTGPGAPPVTGPGGVPVPAQASAPGVPAPAASTSPRRAPSPGIGTAPTTFSAAASQSITLPDPAPPPRRASRVPWLLVPAALAAFGGGALFLIRRAEPPEVTVAAAPPPEVKPVPANPPPEAKPIPVEAQPAAETKPPPREPEGPGPEKPPAEAAPALAEKPAEENPGRPALPRAKPPAPKKPSRGATLHAEGLRLRMAGVEDRALLAYRAALADESLPSALRAEAEAQVIQLSRKFGELEIMSPTSGALVSIDGRPIGRTPLRDPILVRPGKHEITMALAGYQTRQSSVTVAAGRKEVIRLSPQR